MKRTTKRLSKERRAEIDRILAEAAEKARVRERAEEAVVTEAAKTMNPIEFIINIDAAVAQPIRPKKTKQTTWNKIPYGAKKASRRPITPVDAVVTMSVCDHCRKPMWTADKKMETICEDCEFRLINEKHELRQNMETTAGGKLINFFSDNPQPVINSFRPKSEDLI